ncbi:MAG: putative phosphoglycerate mutase [Rhodothermales bacterium]|jgi:probable phosphoglycerate mutase
MSKATTTELLLVRHGATCANEQIPPLLQGYAVDHPLSALGRAQAAEVSALLAEFAIDAVYSSEMARAQETARAIAAPHQLAVGTKAGLHEIDVGRWEGMSWADIEARDSDALHEFRREDGDVAYLGGESFGDVWSRVAPVLAELHADHAGQRIVLVAHKGVNRAVLASLLGLPLSRAKCIAQENCAANVIELTSGGGNVTTMNSTFHLAGVVAKRMGASVLA